MNTLTSDSDLAAGCFAFLLSLTEFAGPLSLSLSHGPRMVEAMWTNLVQ